MSDAIKLLRELEWSGRTESQGANMGDRGRLVRCCPVCGGIKPSDWDRGWSEGVKGHSKNCKLTPFMAPRPEITESILLQLKRSDFEALCKDEYLWIPDENDYVPHRLYTVTTKNKDEVNTTYFSANKVAAILNDLCFRNKLKPGRYIITAG